jgi:mannose-6-phosphate isomerase-like protein (cupin superfamily)
MADIDARPVRAIREEGAMPSEPVVLQPREGRSIDLGNFKMTVKASKDVTKQSFTLLEATEPPDFGPPMHIHHNADEAFYVLEGEYIIFIEDREYRCPAGSFIFIPTGTVHGFRVGGVASRKLNLYAPGVMVEYFDELSAAIAADEADEERLAAIATRNGVEVTGPVPEGYL